MTIETAPKKQRYKNDILGGDEVLFVPVLPREVDALTVNGIEIRPVEFGILGEKYHFSYTQTDKILELISAARTSSGLASFATEERGTFESINPQIRNEQIISFYDAWGRKS